MSLPAILLGFANDSQGAQPLAELEREQQALLDLFSGKMEPVLLVQATLDRVRSRFNDHPGRIRVFHFAGHARPEALLLEPDTEGFSTAYAEGLAPFVGQQGSVALVFLNGCSTRAQVSLFLEAGIQAVIATVHQIQDDTARRFATDFYTGFCAGKSIRTAFDEAFSLLNTRVSRPEEVFRRIGLENQQDLSRNPYELHLKTPAAGEIRLADWIEKNPGTPGGKTYNQQANTIINIDRIENANFS